MFLYCNGDSLLFFAITIEHFQPGVVWEDPNRACYQCMCFLNEINCDIPTPCESVLTCSRVNISYNNYNISYNLKYIHSESVISTQFLANIFAFLFSRDCCVFLYTLHWIIKQNKTNKSGQNRTKTRTKNKIK